MAANQEISDTSPLWWELQNIPTEVVRELRRRSNTNNIGMNIPTPFISTTYDFEKNHKNYKGPMVPWVRVFSNSTGKSLNGMVPKSFYLNKKNLEKDYDGFILKAGDGFFDAFGYQQNKPLSDTYAVIGYEANGDAHYIDNKYRSQMRYLAPEAPENKDFPQNNQVSSILPPPGIVSVTVKQSKEFLTYSTVNFKCFGLAQLEYLTPFFFTAGINVFVEFGWNLFNQNSLINLSKMNECWEIVAKPQTALNRADMSYGNYGCVSGIITKYSFSTKDGFAYDCSFESISRQGLYSGMRIDSNPTIQNTTITSLTNGNTDTRSDKEFIDLKSFVKTYLPKVKELLSTSEVKQINSNGVNKQIISNQNFLEYIIKLISSDALATAGIQPADQLANQQSGVTDKIKTIEQQINDIDGNIKQLEKKDQQLDADRDAAIRRNRQNVIDAVDARSTGRPQVPSLGPTIPPEAATESNYNTEKEKIKKEKEKLETQKGKLMESLANLNKKNATLSNIVNKIKIKDFFYDGKPEDRIFAGRSQDFYKRNPKFTGETDQFDKNDFIDYGIVTPQQSPSDTVNDGQIKRQQAIQGFTPNAEPKKVSYQQASYADKPDFDVDQGSDKIWVQLDFIFDVINLFMSNSATKQFTLDIKDIIVNAHPNLISCDQNVLIPNPVSPKINFGKPKENGGFLKGEMAIVAKNKFLLQTADYRVANNEGLNNKYEAAVKDNKLLEFFKNLDATDGLYIASNSARKTFKTIGRDRDDIDRVINYFYYNSTNNNQPQSAAFPFAEEKTVSRKDKLGKEVFVKYKPYYYGYLKNIYITTKTIIDIAHDVDTKSLKQLINKILTIINESVNNFWKFEIVQGISTDSNGNSVLSIIDKNMNYGPLKQIYTFDLGGSNNVIKSINFDVSLSNEQAISVLFGGQNNSFLNKLANTNDVNAFLTQVQTTPFLKFNDRLEKYQLTTLIANGSLVPGTQSQIEDENLVISDAQSAGASDGIPNGILCMTFIQLGNTFLESINKTPRLDPVVAEGIIPFNYQVFENVDNRRVLNVEKTLANVSNTATRNDYKKAILDRSAKDGAIQTDEYGNTPLDNENKNYKYLCLSEDFKAKLSQMLDDGDFKNNSRYSGVADNFTLSLTFDGIFSFRNLQVFGINNLPKPYVPGNVVFQVLEVEHQINSGKWETIVTALVRCLGSSTVEYITV